MFYLHPQTNWLSKHLGQHFKDSQKCFHWSDKLSLTFYRLRPDKIITIIFLKFSTETGTKAFQQNVPSPSFDSLMTCPGQNTLSTLSNLKLTIHGTKGPQNLLPL